MSRWAVLIALLLLFAVGAPAFGEESLSEDQVRALQTLRQRLETLDDLLARERIPAVLAEQERSHYLGQVAEITSGAGTYAELVTLCEGHEPKPGALSSLWGWFSFLHTVWLIVGVLLVVALWWLASLYLVPLIKRMPRVVIEAVLYAACVAAVLAPAHFLTGGIVFALALAGCLGLVPLLAWSVHLHVQRKDVTSGRIFASVLGLVWGAAALLHSSSLIATLSLIALTSLTGTVVIPILGLAVFLKESVIPGVMLLALALVGTYAGLSVTGQQVPHLQAAVDVFRPGSLWLGTLVFYAGCITISSRHYDARWARFGVAQAVAIVSGFVGLWAGSVFEIDALRETSGTFLAIYLGSKFFDLPWRKERWAWGCLLMALLLWGAATFMERYPSYFLGF